MHTTSANRKAQRLTKTLIENARHDAICWEPETPGFGLRTTPAGAKSFIFQFRTLADEQGRIRGRALAGQRRRCFNCQQADVLGISSPSGPWSPDNSLASALNPYTPRTPNVSERFSAQVVWQTLLVCVRPALGGAIACLTRLCGRAVSSAFGWGCDLPNPA